MSNIHTEHFSWSFDSTSNCEGGIRGRLLPAFRTATNFDPGKLDCCHRAVGHILSTPFHETQFANSNGLETCSIDDIFPLR